MDIVCYLDKKGITILACFPVHRSKNDRVYANNTMPVSKPKKYVYLGLFPVVFEFYNSDLIYELTLGRPTALHGFFSIHNWLLLRGAMTTFGEYTILV